MFESGLKFISYTQMVTNSEHDLFNFLANNKAA